MRRDAIARAPFEKEKYPERGKYICNVRRIHRNLLR